MWRSSVGFTLLRSHPSQFVVIQFYYLCSPVSWTMLRYIVLLQDVFALCKVSNPFILMTTPSSTEWLTWLVWEGGLALVQIVRGLFSCTSLSLSFSLIQSLSIFKQTSVILVLNVCLCFWISKPSSLGLCLCHPGCETLVSSCHHSIHVSPAPIPKCPWSAKQICSDKWSLTMAQFSQWHSILWT